MADERKIVIEIIGSDRSGASKSADSSSVGGTRRVSTVSDTDYNVANQTADFIYDKMVAVKFFAKDIANLTISTGKTAIDTYFVLTESYKAQQTSANVQSVVNHLSSGMSSISSGAMFGSAFGPVGTAIGAGVGAAIWAGSEIVGGITKQFEQKMDLASRSYSVEYNRNLAGLIVGDSRNTEN